MLIKKSSIKKLSEDIRKIIDGQNIDLRDNKQGAFSILKNDVHTLANLKNEQVQSLQKDRDSLKDALADISHQLKTPLTSMLLMADLLENAPREKQAEFIANIKTGLAKTEWLVSALLKMAKLDAHAVEFAEEVITSEQLIKLAIEPLQILLELKEQTLEIKGEAEFVCDKRWTAEALCNVIKNASEHSPQGGKIFIESGGNPICKWIRVVDSGAGLSGATVSKLFKRFEGSSGNGGYGIGLPLALAVMRGQNGDVEVNGGGKGSGAAFTLKFYG